MRFANHATQLMLALLAVISSLMLCGCESVTMPIFMADSGLLGVQTIQTANRFPLGFAQQGFDGESGAEANESDSASKNTAAVPASPGSTLPANRPNRLMVYSARYRLATSNVEQALGRVD